MQAVILVGGFGTRLRPLTYHTPKQMLPVLDVPMIERVVRELAGHGVTDAVLSLGYRPDAFTEAYPDGTCAGIRLHYAVEPEPLDTAGAVRFAARDAGIDDTFLVLNGDVLTDLDVDELWKVHRESEAEGTIHLVRVEDPSRFGVVPIDAEGRVEAFIEKPPREEAPSHWINAGTYVLEPSVLDRIPGDRKVSIERETFPAMVADRTLFALQRDVYWVDAGTPLTYLQVQLDLIDGHRGFTEPGVSEGAVVDPTATVNHAVVMAGAEIGPGALVRDSVVLPGARLEAGAEVYHSIVGPRSVVGSRAVLRDLCVLGEGVEVAPGTELAEAKLPEAG